MDQRAFAFATRGHCIKGKQCQHITITNQNMSLCSKQSSLFSFYALPSGGKSKGAMVHWFLRTLTIWVSFTVQLNPPPLSAWFEFDQTSTAVANST